MKGWAEVGRYHVDYIVLRGVVSRLVHKPKSVVVRRHKWKNRTIFKDVEYPIRISSLDPNATSTSAILVSGLKLPAG